MFTARRPEEYSDSENESNVCLLERKVPESYSEYVNGEEEEQIDEARARMQRNLEKLLNYEKYAKNAENETVDSIEGSTIVEETVAEAPAIADDDITPSSTTMQFGNEDAENVYNDMEKSKEEKKENYHLNFKGKLVVAVYCVAVAVILALIILNTGVLTTLNESNSRYEQALNAKMQEYNAVIDEIEYVSSSDYVSNIAENVYGMQK